MQLNRTRSSIFSNFLVNGIVCLLALGTVARADISTAQLDRAQQAPGVPAQLKEVGITEHLGDLVSIQSLQFKNEKGEDVKLADYFHKGRPVVLNLVYFECPSLCSLVLNGFVKTLKALEWTPGKEFDVVTLSIDPREGSALAASKKEAYLQVYGRPEAASGWHFLTGKEADIKKLAAEVGFGYKFVPEEQQFAHSAALFALTPEGKVSRYLYGIDFAARDMKLALLEASNGKVGTIVDRFLLFCYRYDSVTHKYSVYLAKLMQAGCAGTVVVFGGYLGVFWNRQRRRTGELKSEGSPERKKEV